MLVGGEAELRETSQTLEGEIIKTLLCFFFLLTERLWQLRTVVALWREVRPEKAPRSRHLESLSAYPLIACVSIQLHVRG